LENIAVLSYVDGLFLDLTCRHFLFLVIHLMMLENIAVVMQISRCQYVSIVSMVCSVVRERLSTCKV